MKKEWMTPEITCLSVEETNGYGTGSTPDAGWAVSWGPNDVSMVSGETEPQEFN